VTPRTVFALVWALMLHGLLIMALLWGLRSPAGDGGAETASSITVDVRLSPPPPRPPVVEPRRQAAPAPASAAPPAMDAAAVQPAPVEAVPPARDVAPPPSPPVAKAPERQTQGVPDAYLGALRAHLGRHYRAVPVSGRADVWVRIGGDGRIESLRATAGDPSARTEALALLRRADPLPAPPDARALSLVVPLEFR
jgi:protein TonB